MKIGNEWLARQRARRILRTLSAPRPWTRETLLREVSRRRGRPIYIEQVASGLTTEAGGLLLELDDGDHLVIGAGLPRWHQDAVIAHELGHILLGHSGELASADAENGIEEMLPDLDMELVRNVLGRSCHADRDEYEAEYLGTLILTEMNTGIEVAEWLGKSLRQSGARELWRAFGVDRA